MKQLDNILAQNKEWARTMVTNDSEFFSRLANQQSPELLWIGCADSRVSANQICGLLPGEIFVHRNIANLVHYTDVNCLSVVQYAIEVLRVKHIIVCGHYGCGGVVAAMQNRELGLIDHWLRNLKDLYLQNKVQIDGIDDPNAKINFMCEQNVRQQVTNLCHTTFVQNAWKNGQDLTVHGWIYDIKDGHIRDLNACYDQIEQVPEIYRIKD